MRTSRAGPRLGQSAESGDIHSHVFVAGHRGCGKSTEIARCDDPAWLASILEEAGLMLRDYLLERREGS